MHEKWYVLQWNKYYGPFKTDQLVQLILERKIVSKSHLWKEGMKDWSPLMDLKSFSLYTANFSETSHESLDEIKKLDAELNQMARSTKSIKSEDSFQIINKWKQYKRKPVRDPISIYEKNPSHFHSGININPSLTNSIDLWNPQSQKLGTPSFTSPNKESENKIEPLPSLEKNKKSGSINMFFPERKKTYGLFIMSATLVIIYFMISISKNSKPLPILDDLNQEEYTALVHMTSLPPSGLIPQGALALSTLDPQHPTFYVAINQEKSIKLFLKIEGLSETLVDRFNVSIEVPIVVRDKWIATPPLSLENGNAFPTGLYNVKIIFQHHNQQNLIFEKIFSLGDVSTQQYRTNLSIYHAQLRKKAIEEIKEIQQINNLLDQQLQAIHFTFNNQHLKQKEQQNNLTSIPPLQWEDLQNQLHLIFAHWNSVKMNEQYFHFDLYALIKETSVLIERIYDQSKKIQSISNPTQLKKQNQILEDISLAQSSILSIRSKTILYSRLHETQTGFPSRQ